MTLNLNCCFWLFKLSLLPLFPVEQTLNLWNASIVQLEMIGSSTFTTFEVVYLLILIVQENGLKGTINDGLIGVGDSLEIDFVQANQLAVSPYLNDNLIIGSIGRWSIVREDVDVLAFIQLCHSELDAFLRKWNFIANLAAVVAKITQRQVYLDYFDGLLVL
jgi:hypothetical protein